VANGCATVTDASGNGASRYDRLGGHEGGREGRWQPNERSVNGPPNVGALDGPIRTYAPSWEGTDMEDATTNQGRLPVLYLDEVTLFATFGVGDLVGVEGTEDRVVTLSERSDVVCPMHEKRLVPDACRSCRLLAGEVGRGRPGEGEASAA
jgi:hypothetical protein